MLVVVTHATAFLQGKLHIKSPFKREFCLHITRLEKYYYATLPSYLPDSVTRNTFSRLGMEHMLTHTIDPGFTLPYTLVPTPIVCHCTE